MRKMKKYLGFLFVAFVLTGCSPDSFNGFAKQVERSVVQMVYDIKNYDYKKLWYNISTSYKIAKRTRYFEKQSLGVETARDTQVSVYNGILEDCKRFECNVLVSKLDKSLVFPEHIVGTVVFEISSPIAGDFINSVGKYGNIIKSDYSKDEKISDDLAEYESELALLTQNLQKVKDDVAKKDVYTSDKIQKFEDEIASLEKKIDLLNSTVRYLKHVQGTRLMKITIERGYNSIFALMKAKIRSAVLFIADNANFVVIFFAIYLVWLCVKYIKSFVVFLITFVVKGKRKVKQKEEKQLQQEDEKIPPKF